MKTVILFIMFGLAVILVVWLAVVKIKTNNLPIISQSEQIQPASKPLPTVTAILTPTPLIIDDKTNLAEEIDKLTPADFSDDFQQLGDIIVVM